MQGSVLPDEISGEGFPEIGVALAELVEDVENEDVKAEVDKDQASGDQIIVADGPHPVVANLSVFDRMVVHDRED